MITKVEINGYKSIKHQVIDLNSINILIGGNGVGKSNFISIFSLIRNIYERNLQRYVIDKGGADSFLHFGKKVTDAISLDFYFGEQGPNGAINEFNCFKIVLAEARDELFIVKTGTSFFNGIWHDRTYEENVRESEFSTINQGQAYWVNDRLKEFEVYHFHDTGDKSPMKGKSNIDDNFALRRDGSNIASFLYYLQVSHPKHFYRIERTIKSIAPFFDKFTLRPDRLNPNLIQLEWKEVGAVDGYFNANNLSDGTLRFICLATLLMQPEPPTTIIIDEPELGLHPVAVNKLAGLIKRAATEVQIIISSQSVNLVDNFGPEDLIVSDRKDNQSIFSRLNEESLTAWLKDYTLGEVWEKNVIGGLPLDRM
jgi:predicted ATPase